MLEMVWMAKLRIFILGTEVYAKVSILFIFFIPFIAHLAQVSRPFGVIMIAFGYWLLTPTSTSLLQVKKAPTQCLIGCCEEKTFSI